MPAKGWKKAPDGTWVPPNVKAHVIELSKDLDAQLTRALDIAQQKVLIDPVTSTLGNPVAFPIIIGAIGLLGIVLYLKFKFPDPAAQATEIVRDAAEKAVDVLKEIEERVDPPREEGEGPSTLDVLKENLVDLAMRLWNDPLFGVGGQGPFIPGRGPLG